MADEHAVVWCEPGGPRFVGKLRIDGGGLRLQGTSAEGELGSRILGPEDIVRVRLDRPAPDDADGSRRLVLEQPDGSTLTVVGLNGAGALFEIAQVAAEMAGSARSRSETVAVEVPIRRGHRDRIRELVRKGPPFDPSTVPELESHDVYVGPDHVVFVFRGGNVREALEKVMHNATVWMAASEWRRSVSGRPRVLEDGYAWRRHDPRDG
jgi:hypothetical protein